jgi:DNA-binding MarR family transcriptional regulator
MAGRLAGEIRQAKPFGSLEEEAYLNLLRTASVVEQAVAGILKPHGLSSTQYNALRILRGAGPRGLACQEIAGRMIARDPDITRLLDRLEARALVGRARSPVDRRVVVTRISAKGLKLLASMDSAARQLPKRVLGHLGEKKLRTLIDHLEQARSGPAE